MLLGILIAICVLQAGANEIENGNSNKADEQQIAQQQASGIDFLHFWLAPKMQRHDEVASVYDRDQHPKIIELADRISRIDQSTRLTSLLKENKRLYSTAFEPTGSPFLYSILGTIHTGNFETDYKIFQTLSTLLLVIGIFLLGRINNLSNWISVSLLVLLFAIYRPLHVEISVANVNRIQIFLFAVYIYLVAGNRFIYAGIVLGLATAFKLNFLCVAIVVIGGSMFEKNNRHSAGKLVGGFVIGLAIAIVYGAIYFGSAIHWVHWHQYVKTFVATAQPIELGNYSTQQLLGTNLTLAPLLVAIGLAVAMGRSHRHQKIQDIPDAFGQSFACAGLLAFLICSPLVWSHYFVLAIPPTVHLLNPTMLRRSSIVSVLLSCGALFTSGVLSRWLTPFQNAAILQAGVLCLLGAVIYADRFSEIVRAQKQKLTA